MLYFIYPRSFELFSQHSCQVVHHTAPQLPGTRNTLNYKIPQQALNQFFFEKSSKHNNVAPTLEWIPSIMHFPQNNDDINSVAACHKFKCLVQCTLFIT